MSDPRAAAALAKQVVAEDAHALKVVVVEHGAEAGVVGTLLQKAHRIPKGQITQLGMTCSDDQIVELLRAARPIAIVPKGIINNRHCPFHLPPGSTELIAIQWLDGQVETFPMTCEGPTYTFPPNWFS